MKDKILTISDSGRVVLTKEFLDEYYKNTELLDKCNTKDSKLRNALLNEMLEQNVDSLSEEYFDKKLKFSLVIPKPIEIFDENSFLLNESNDIVNYFTDYEEEISFDIERFKEENKELYEKYVIKTCRPIVDKNKLKTSLPSIYDKYYSEKQSTKKTTLRITCK